MTKLSVLLPVRDNGNIDIVERLSWRKGRVEEFPDIEFIAVDDGSPEPDNIREACLSLGIRYVRLETRDAPFSLARSRNAGIKHSSGEYIYFEDLDFLHKADFYGRLLDLIEDNFLDRIPFNFLSVPTLFLKEEASKELMSSPNFDKCFDRFVARLPFIDTDSENDLCDIYAPVGSNIFLKRETCFHVGLFDEYFNSWGGEDREFVFRLLHHNSKVLRPLQMHVTKSWKLHRTSAYEGWRSLYRLHGEVLADMGLYAMHIYHPENPWKSKFSREQNFRYCNDKIAAIGSAGRVKIEPVPTSGDKVNIFIGHNIIFNNDEVINVLGNVEIVPMNDQMDPVEFSKNILERDPRSVFFQNPYGRPWLKAVWDDLKSRGIRCVCAERGAFPGTIYFDDDFCGESASYEKDLWKDSDPVDTYSFISSLRSQNNALEPQGRGDFSSFREKVRGQEKRNVLVLLQSVTDATTLHFTGDLPSYKDFIDGIRSLEGVEGINLLIKNHPLNKYNPLDGVGVDVSDLNIYDLFDVADSCITLNSGAGLLALGAGVPVIAMGKCFYAQEELAISCSDIDRVQRLITSNLSANRVEVGRFYGYLLNEFYSFADWIYGARDNGPQANMSLMSRLVYRSIKIAGFEDRELRPKMTASDLCMVPYQLFMFQNKEKFRGEVRQSEVEKVVKAVVPLKADFADDLVEEGADYERRLEAASVAFYQGLHGKAGDLFLELSEQVLKPGTLRAAAEAYVCAGRVDRGIALYERAAELAPGHGRIISRLQELKEDRHDKLLSANCYRIARPRRPMSIF
ncbi:glycosyltransferase [Salipiger bermudensis]|uniref:glycosyltransferase n=1 Tax=Salipiger bermudensis TaxID=344736 RepID=UPI001A8CC0E8|nr:glycosyltransferase [Salipiger bermudensis]MBN9678420.1 glycosyltransferase [Salipiger bermudensis]